MYMRVSGSLKAHMALTKKLQILSFYCFLYVLRNVRLSEFVDAVVWSRTPLLSWSDT